MRITYLEKPETEARGEAPTYISTFVASLRLVLQHAEEPEEDFPSVEWYRAAYARLIRLTHVLRHVQWINKRMTNINGNSVILDGHIIKRSHEFISLAKAFIALPSMQHAVHMKSSRQHFSKPSERRSMTLDSLTKVCNFLNISAQQRKTIRLTICPQVTQPRIWRGALEQILANLNSDMDSFKYRSPQFLMGKQIVSTCIKFVADATELSESETPSWMRATPIKKVEKLDTGRKWEEVLEMFVDLSKCLQQEERQAALAAYVAKLEAMKEGLYQIKDILVERDVSYKEARRQDCLVQKKLTKSLGHSSKCLFTLLLYYLHGSVGDIEVDVCGGGGVNGDGFNLSLGKLLTCSEEEVVWNGVKLLSRALGVFKFVWETAGMKGKLVMEGHLWYLGAEERTITYRGNHFFVHDIRL